MFTPEQKAIIESFGKGQAVVAGAGCGKTTTLVAKCLALIALKPNAKFCAVSFTEKSVRDLKDSLANGFLKAGIYEKRHAHWVKTIHGLCSTIIQEFPTAAGLQGGERILVEEESARLWQKSLNLLWSQNENEAITNAIVRLLAIYSKSTLENLFQKLRSLKSFGVDDMIEKSFHRPEVQDLWICFESIYQRYHHYKTRDGALDFNDLELYALKALENETVRRYYHDRFELVLVDEYQDTNPIQGKILEFFAKPSYQNLCVVGDPKQSIYRFRDADVTVFQELTEKLPLKHLLDTNYRSKPEIIEFVNQVCDPVFQASQLSYEPLKAGRAGERLPDSDELAPPGKVSRLPIETEADIARFFLQEQNAGKDLSEYVILVRSIRKEKTQNYLNELSNQQVPYLLGSGGRFFADPRVQELVALLKGMVSPKNTLSQATALRSPWIAIPDETLMEWKDVFFEKFFTSSEHFIAKALKNLYFNRAHHRPGEILEALWNAEGLDEELEIQLITLWHKAEALSAQGLRFEEVVQSFTHAIETDKMEKEIPPPTQKGAVRVLTIHGSKGLQFPRVVLLDFDGEYKSGGGSRDLIWDRKKGVHLFLRDEQGKKDAKDDENIAWEELEKQSAVAESKRLFYVAITRPQEELILAWKNEVKVPAAAKKPDFNPLLRDGWRGWVEATVLPPLLQLETHIHKPESSQLSLLLDDPALRAETRLHLKDRVLVRSYRPRHSPSEWMILNQCQLRYHFQYWKILKEDEGKISRAYTLFETETKTKESALSKNASETGEKIHFAIESENWDELSNDYQFDSDQLRSLLNEEAEIFKEFGFEVPLNGNEALVGMMDRLELDEANESFRVIDYKWTAQEKTESALMDHYQLQLQLYAWATSKLLHFKPKKISAAIIHLSQSQIQKVELSQDFLNLDAIEAKVFDLHQKVYSVPDNGLPMPTRGEHCRYCDFKARCPLFSTS